ncbi:MULTISPECIES: SpoIIE family protein phosphatase [Thalassospira]|uniref:Transcriptional regulator n=2 Tax=Thalassospira TaxID=168934 RepID=A0A367W1B2_9PROT|nr:MULTISPECIES: SpoIIE family protein phosphatase [Thalassospira]MDG4720243.1 SpoIIE family protein phosphatase [Thalassospira sp. FZY0004]RCK33095.1 transcriptional regulator [Thalassospira profundimaris]
MAPGKESRINHTIAVAQSIVQTDIDALLASGAIWESPQSVSLQNAVAQTPEDLPHGSYFSACLLPTDSGREWLGGLTRLNCETFIECSSEIDFADLAPLISDTTDRKNALTVCLSTRSAYYLPVARKFVTALRHRGLIGEKIAATVEMAVQEAFANSLIHGNLELDTSGHLTMDGFTELGEETRRRLASTKHGARVILLTARRRKNGRIIITINDQGKGFTPPKDTCPTTVSGRKTTFGRGLPLIRSLCHSVNFAREGRTIELEFVQDANDLIPVTDSFSPNLGDQHHQVADADIRNAYNATILIADDTMLSREIIASYLRADGFTNLVFAKDGEDAIEQAVKHDPDLIILDIIMPKLDGYGVCKALRANPDFAKTPIIAQTALEENEGRTRIFDDGATDLILKPLNKAELIARTKIHLENRLLVKQLQAYQERTRSELTLARDMQENLNPTPENYRGTGLDYGLRISATFQMSSELGGDMWGLVPIDEHRLGVYIVDFAGHGLGAALNTFRLHSLIWSDQLQDRDPAEYLEGLNRHLKGLLPVGQYATMLYGIIDRVHNTFRYASAACTSPVLGNSLTGQARYLDGSGVPLGVIRNARYETREVPFTGANFLLLYSDALIETTLDDGQFLSEEKLLSMLRETIMESQREIDLAAQIADQFMDRAPAKLSDDFTIISLQSTPIPCAI